eukprot:scaffold15954_cov62-Phaeocystis_antarctica.AAC.2
MYSKLRPLRGIRARHMPGPSCTLAPGVPRYAVRTARPRLVRVQRRYSGAPPGASCPAPQVRAVRRRPARVPCAYGTAAALYGY